MVLMYLKEPQGCKSNNTTKRRSQSTTPAVVNDFRHSDARCKNNMLAGIAPTYEVHEHQTTYIYRMLGTLSFSSELGKHNHVAMKRNDFQRNGVVKAVKVGGNSRD